MVFALLTSMYFAQATGSLYDGPIAGTDQTIAVTQAGASFKNMPLNVTQNTDGLKVKGFRWVEWTALYTFGAASAVTMQCDQSEDGLVWATIEYLTFSGAVASSAPMTWSKATTASTNWAWVVPNHGVYQRCRLSSTGGSAADKVTLLARGGV